MTEFSVNSNPGALVALQQLTLTNRALQQTQNRVNTGLEVAGARDDAGTFAIAQNLRADLGGFDAVKGSLDRAGSVLDVAIAAAESISDLLIEAKEKAVAAADEGLDEESRRALDTDFQAILQQIDTVAKGAEFNGSNLLQTNPDAISAITDPSADPNRAIKVQGIDITTIGLNLRRDASGGEGTNLLRASTTVTLDSTSLDSTAEFATLSSDSAALQAIKDQGLDTDNVIDDSSGTAAFKFDGSSALFNDPNATPGDGDETVTFNIGGAAVTLTGTFNGVVDADTPSNITAVATTGTQSIIVDATTAGVGETLNLGGDDTGTLTENDPFISFLDLDDDFDGLIDTAEGYSTGARASEAIVLVDTALKAVNDALTQLGAGAETVESQRIFVDRLSDTVEVGIGNLVDANLARESAKLQSLQVRQQLGVQALSIANREPQIILSLFGN